MILYYYPQGDPVTSDEPPIGVNSYDEIAAKFGDKVSWHVALTQIDMTTGEAHDIAQSAFDDSEGDKLFVSTVFLSLDHSFRDGPPILWESLPFKGGGLDRMMQRYTSRRSAIAGHIALVRFLSDRVKNGEIIDDETEFDYEDDRHLPPATAAPSDERSRLR